MSTICPVCHITTPCFDDHPVEQLPVDEIVTVVAHAVAAALTAPPRLRRPTPKVARPRDGERCEHLDDSAQQYACQQCTDRLAKHLAALPGYMTDLEIAITKQAKLSTAAGEGNGLAFAPLASEVAWNTRNTLLQWVDEIATIRGHQIPPRWSTIADYLIAALPWISRHPAGYWIVDELTDAIHQAAKIIDRPPDLLFIGRCSALILIDGCAETCPEYVYARQGAPNTDCRRCGTIHDVNARRTVMLDAIETLELPATDLARAVNGLLGTDTIASTTIRQWAKRGQIHPVGLTDRGHPTYLVSDVLNRALGVITDTPSPVGRAG